MGELHVTNYRLLFKPALALEQARAQVGLLQCTVPSALNHMASRRPSSSAVVPDHGPPLRGQLAADTAHAGAPA